MKIFIDNNLPATLARAINALIQPLEHSATHIQDKESLAKDTPDIEWIQMLQKEGNWVVLTQDKLKKGAERQALADSGLVVYLLTGKQWTKLTYLEKNLAIIEWIEALIEHAEPALEEAQKKKKGSAWSIVYKPNRRKYKIERLRL